MCTSVIYPINTLHAQDENEHGYLNNINTLYKYEYLFFYAGKSYKEIELKNFLLIYLYIKIYIIFI